MKVCSINEDRDVYEYWIYNNILYNHLKIVSSLLIQLFTNIECRRYLSVYYLLCAKVSLVLLISRSLLIEDLPGFGQRDGCVNGYKLNIRRNRTLQWALPIKTDLNFTLEAPRY